MEELRLLRRAGASVSEHEPQPSPTPTRTPYARSHPSDLTMHTAPPMVRAHSLPTVIGASASTMSSSSSSPRALIPSPTPMARPSSPLRFSGAPRVCDISEDAELDLTPRTPTTSAPLSNLHSSVTPLNRAGRRRPASPLHHVVPFGSTPAPASSPLLSPAKFNEPFPGVNAHYPPSLSSSMPSTPTSMRSRSPSISSLETIPDTPDAEAEALEDDRIARLKAAAERENGDDESGRRSSLDVPNERRNLGFGRRDSRKRWSVCGAERRQDLDLETIWED